MKEQRVEKLPSKGDERKCPHCESIMIYDWVNHGKSNALIYNEVTKNLVPEQGVETTKAQHLKDGLFFCTKCVFATRYEK